MWIAKQRWRKAHTSRIGRFPYGALALPCGLRIPQLMAGVLFRNDSHGNFIANCKCRPIEIWCHTCRLSQGCGTICVPRQASLNGRVACAASVYFGAEERLFLFIPHCSFSANSKRRFKNLVASKIANCNKNETNHLNGRPLHYFLAKLRKCTSATSYFGCFQNRINNSKATNSVQQAASQRHD